MSDCCEAEAAEDRCLRCGGRGRRVPRLTMESLLKPEARARLRPTPYFFDRTPTCDVVYFSNDPPSYYSKDDLTVRVGLKETAPPVPLCYCFGHTLESARAEIAATGRSTLAKRIALEVRSGNCSCAVENPSGRCCLPDVHPAVERIQRELAEGAGTRVPVLDGGSS